jgi:DNA-directed RNA polymerase specialized sigma24 family protein
MSDEVLEYIRRAKREAEKFRCRSGAEMAQRKDREAAKIRGFLAELTEFRVRRGAKRLVTTPGEIAERTGLDVETVERWLSRAAKKRAEGRVLVVRVGRTDVVLRLTAAPRAHALQEIS